MVCCCDDLKRIAYFFLDGELGDEEGKAVQSHIDGCPNCKDRIVIHRRLRILVRKRLGSQTASERLRQRIRAAFNGSTSATL